MLPTTRATRTNSVVCPIEGGVVPMAPRPMTTTIRIGKIRWLLQTMQMSMLIRVLTIVGGIRISRNYLYSLNSYRTTKVNNNCSWLSAMRLGWVEVICMINLRHPPLRLSLCRISLSVCASPNGPCTFNSDTGVSMRVWGRCANFSVKNLGTKK